MSKNVTNIEYGDVLTSIKRLVSDEISEQSGTDQAGVDRFVLTPAYRVMDNIGVTDVAGTDTSKTDLPPLGGMPLTASRTEVRKAAKYVAMEEAWTQELESVSDLDQAIVPAQPKDDSLERRIAELEEAVARSHDEWEPDGSEADLKIEPRQRIFEVIDNTRKADIPVDNKPDTGAISRHDGATPMFTHMAQDDQPYLLSERVPEEDAESFRKKTASSSVNLDNKPRGDLVDNDDVFLDVEALRGMISDVVREELRGSMGESITLNLRRMVRQEIRAALLPRDKE